MASGVLTLKLIRRHSRALLWSTFAMLVVAGSYWGLKTTLGVREIPSTRLRVYHLSIPAAGEQIQSPVFNAAQGDTVMLVIHSDRPGELHVHAYQEIATKLKPGASVSLTFIAKDSGHFAIHVHDPNGSMHHVAILEVQPK